MGDLQRSKLPCHPRTGQEKLFIKHNGVRSLRGFLVVVNLTRRRKMECLAKHGCVPGEN